MKNLITVFFLFFLISIFAQETNDKNQTKFGFEVTAKFGSSKLDVKEAVDLNGNFSAGDFLVVYRLNQYSIFKSGITIAEFNSNFTASGETASLKNSYLQIPLKYFYVTSLSNNVINDSTINLLFGLGVNANHLYQSKIETVNTSNSNKNLGWNLGSSFEMGLDFSFSKYMNFGIFYEAMTDITRNEKENNNQKLVGTNLIKFSYIINF